MTPRALRQAIESGDWTCVTRRMPEPPPEWPEPRRDRMRVAIRCAVLFVGGHTASQIVSNMRRKGLMDSDLSRQRINQYVDKGLKFLLDRGVFEQVKKG